MPIPWHDVVAIRTGSEQSHVVRQTECLGDMKSPLAKNYMPIHAYAARPTYRHVPLTGDKNQRSINSRNLSKLDSDWISRPKQIRTYEKQKHTSIIQAIRKYDDVAEYRQGGLIDSSAY